MGQITLPGRGLGELLERAFCMHDLLIALVFLAMIAGPSLVASFSKTESEEDV